MGRKRAAPQRSGEGELRAHPLIEKLAEASEDDGVVELRGFIGPDDGDAVRLYRSLELTECLLVPRDAIVHVSEPEPEQANDQPTRIYVKGSTEVRLISRRVTTIRADVASAATRTTGRRIDDAVDICNEGLWTCLLLRGPEARYDIHHQIRCLSSYGRCVEAAREADRTSPWG